MEGQGHGAPLPFQAQPLHRLQHMVMQQGPAKAGLLAAEQVLTRPSGGGTQ